MRVCRDAGLRQCVSHRSGETEDTFSADLAAAAGCGHLKSGAPAAATVGNYHRLPQISDRRQVALHRAAP